MRSKLDGEVLAGTAEAIPLSDNAVDAVFVGEAFHWFDAERALAEIRRVGARPNGLPAKLGRDGAAGLLPPPVWAELDAIWLRFHGARAEANFPEWRDTVKPDGPARFEETLRISGRDLVDLHMTGSTPASIPEEERAAIAVRAYPLMEDAYEMRVVTELYRSRFTSGKGV